ncbi:MAG: hypothetical protein HDKAJFGB_03743 [Anaerolineae bacterium]|nr:hypothetical protein [Anaerolineae bacterium]
MTAASASAHDQNDATPPRRFAFLQTSNTYSIFILVLTILSLALMVVQFLLPPDSETWKLVNLYNNLTCIIFLADFALHMLQGPRWQDYFFGQRGYFDLLGSIPNFGFSQYTAILRIFRISRLLRLRRLMNPANRKLLREEVINNRGAYALFFTLMLVALVITIGSIMVLFFESQSPDANIQDGGDAVWWCFVTITTVGYGDRFPVTEGGRFTGVFIMAAGVGVIGALASILASILVPQPKEPEPQAPQSISASAVEQELAAMKKELGALRELLEQARNG